MHDLQSLAYIFSREDRRTAWDKLCAMFGTHLTINRRFAFFDLPLEVRRLLF